MLINSLTTAEQIKAVAKLIRVLSFLLLANLQLQTVALAQELKCLHIYTAKIEEQAKLIAEHKTVMEKVGDFFAGIQENACGPTWLCSHALIFVAVKNALEQL